jgi:hypothetical protein
MDDKRPSTLQQDTERPFNMPWLDSSFYETILPVTPWQNVNIHIFKYSFWLLKWVELNV